MTTTEGALRGIGKPRLSFSISAKIAWVFVGLLVLTGANLIVVRAMLQQLNGVAETISVAGKLRMLSQKIAFETVRSLHTATPDDTTVRTLIQDFDRALSALQHGGTAFNYVVAALPVEAQPPLDAIGASWRTYRLGIEAVLAQRPAMPDRSIQIERMSVQADQVLTGA